MSEKKAILFDLGGTLVHYFTRAEALVVIKQGITNVQSYLLRKGLLAVSQEEMWRRFDQENYEAEDYQVRALEVRLSNIFDIGAKGRPEGLMEEMCRSFMKPVFDRGHIYKDTIAVLEKLKAQDYKTALVSNTTWGSPPYLWREEIAKYKLDRFMDVIIFCRNVGRRKPARRIFDFVLDKLKMKPEQCLVVGDHPVWDVKGAQNAGIDAVLIDRSGSWQVKTTKSINSLYELERFL